MMLMCEWEKVHAQFCICSWSEHRKLPTANSAWSQAGTTICVIHLSCVNTSGSAVVTDHWSGHKNKLAQTHDGRHQGGQLVEKCKTVMGLTFRKKELVAAWLAKRFSFAVQRFTVYFNFFKNIQKETRQWCPVNLHFTLNSRPLSMSQDFLSDYSTHCTA